jgi:transposase
VTEFVETLERVCIEARQAKATMPNKADCSNDANGIAPITGTDWYRTLHVKSPSCRSWRALLTVRRMVPDKKRREAENGPRGVTPLGQ